MPRELPHWRLAPMSRPIRILTWLLYWLPVAFLLAALTGKAPILFWPGIVVLCIFALVWMVFRPTRFELDDAELIVRRPLLRSRFPLSSLQRVQLIDATELKARLGFAVRFGVAGLWGVFGILWSRKAGRVSTWISSSDQFVWMEFSDRPPLLITPEHPDSFIAELQKRR